MLALDQRTELVCLSNSFGLLSESSCNLSCSRRSGSVSSVRAGVALCTVLVLMAADGGRPLFIDCAREASLSHFSCLTLFTSGALFCCSV